MLTNSQITNAVIRLHHAVEYIVFLIPVKQTQFFFSFFFFLIAMFHRSISKGIRRLEISRCNLSVCTDKQRNSFSRSPSFCKTWNSYWKQNQTKKQTTKQKQNKTATNQPKPENQTSKGLRINFWRPWYKAPSFWQAKRVLISSYKLNIQRDATVINSIIMIQSIHWHFPIWQGWLLDHNLSSSFPNSQRV